MKTDNKNNEFNFFENNKYEEEVNFGQVFKSSHRTFGVFYLMVVIGIIIAGLAYLDNLSWIGINKYDDTVIIPVYEQELIEQKRSVTLAGVDVMAAAVPSDEDILRGQEVYSEYCTSCHGNEGKGDGAAGAALNPPPRNFHVEDGWTNGRKISDIYKTLEEGIIENGMSAYDYLPVEDRFALAHFIRSLMEAPPMDTDSDLQNLDLAYGLSEGKTTNNQIPLEKAMRIIAEENTTSNLSVSSAMRRINTMADEDVKRIFNTSFTNQRQALGMLARDGGWRGSLTAFEDYIRPDMGRNGFGSGYSKLKLDDRMRLHTVLRDYMTVVPQNIIEAEDNVPMEPSDYKFTTKEEAIFDE
jgi:mono/diheme cytochrome c family protein